MENHRRAPLRAFALLLLLPALLAPCGCEKARDLLDRIAGMMESSPRGGRRSPLVSDRERIVRKFGQPREKIGVGRGAHTENGVTYDRKWNYYYPSKRGAGSTMRTVYFLNERFVGSVIRRPGEKARKERVRFTY